MTMKKKIAKFLGTALRGVIVMSPAAVAFVWLLSVHGWLVALLAALGVEFAFGVVVAVLTTLAAQIKAQRDVENIKADD